MTSGRLVNIPSNFRSRESPEKTGNVWRLFIQDVVTLNSKLFTKYLGTRPGKQIHTKKTPEKHMHLKHFIIYLEHACLIDQQSQLSV